MQCLGLKMKSLSSAIIYEGGSLFDGSPIVVIATGLSGNSANKKTGVVVNTWILRSNIDPVDARKSGSDSSICGDCRHRVGSCYVEIYRAPLTIYRKYKLGEYEAITGPVLRNLTAGKALRIGTYGDPAAVPLSIWNFFTERASHWTGYTHQWRLATTLQRFCMASVDNAAEQAEATALGWRTFRVRTGGEPLLKSEFTCPASTEAGKVLTCQQCNSCDGSRRQKGNPAILVHGITGKRRTFYWAHEMPHGKLAAVNNKLRALGLAVESNSPAAKLRRQLHDEAKRG